MRREIAGANTTASEMKPPQVPRPQGRIAKPVRRSHPSSGPNGRGFVGFVDSGSPRKHNLGNRSPKGFRSSRAYRISLATFLGCQPSRSSCRILPMTCTRQHRSSRYLASVAGRDLIRAKGIMAGGACEGRIEGRNTWPHQPADRVSPKKPLANGEPSTHAQNGPSALRPSRTYGADPGFPGSGHW
jgi:hypothetical protein